MNDELTTMAPVQRFVEEVGGEKKQSGGGERPRR
jgi:hypothetical protein